MVLGLVLKSEMFAFILQKYSKNSNTEIVLQLKITDFLFEYNLKCNLFL